MPQRYQGGKMKTGIQGTMNSELAETKDIVGAKPKVADGAICFKQKFGPLSVVTPNGRHIVFKNGYFVTDDAALIKHLRDNHVPKNCIEVQPEPKAEVNEG